MKNPHADLLQLLLIDLNDQQDFDKEIPTNYAACSRIRVLLASGKTQEAIKLAIQFKLFDLAFYLGDKSEETKQLFKTEFETKLCQFFTFDQSANAFQALAWMLTQEVPAEKMLALLKQEPELMQVVFVLCGVPLVYQSKF